MKLFQKKKNNKGFSLVELIVVVAIMAVLMGILVPTLVKNVEKSKIQKDESAIEEIRSQMQNSLADPKFSHIESVVTYNDESGKKIDIDGPTSCPPGTATDATEIKAYLAEVALNVEDYAFTSKKYKADPLVVFVIGDEKVKVYRSAANEKAPAAGDDSSTS
jgi:type IV pilus assembly protein PilA